MALDNAEEQQVDRVWRITSEERTLHRTESLFPLQVLVTVAFWFLAPSHEHCKTNQQKKVENSKTAQEIVDQTLWQRWTGITSKAELTPKSSPKVCPVQHTPPGASYSVHVLI